MSSKIDFHFPSCENNKLIVIASVLHYFVFSTFSFGFMRGNEKNSKPNLGKKRNSEAYKLYKRSPQIYEKTGGKSLVN